MTGCLVVYYSRAGENYMPDGIRALEKGHTAYAAEYIQKALSSDILQIETVTPYAEGYRECCMQAVAEAKENARPAIQPVSVDMARYDTVFVCFPCWCGTAPMGVFTFLEQQNMTGKRIFPLCTNEGSGLANAPRDLQRSCPGAMIGEGLSIRGHQVRDSENVIADWAKSVI